MRKLEMVDIKACGDLYVSYVCDVAAWPKLSFVRYAYFPFGVVVASVRCVFLFFMFIVSFFLPASGKNFFYSMFLKILGISVSFNVHRKKIADYAQGCVVASNHVSLFDFLIITDLPRTVIISKNSPKEPKLFDKLLEKFFLIWTGTQFWSSHDKRALVRHFMDLREDPVGAVVYSTPEGTIGNGRGLFRFLPATLCRGTPVIPAALRVTLPFGVKPHPITESGFVIACRLLMMPWLRYELTYLEKQIRAPGQTVEEFSDQIQAVVANYLEIPATSFRREDKLALRAALKAKNCRKRR